MFLGFHPGYELFAAFQQAFYLPVAFPQLRGEHSHAWRVRLVAVEMSYLFEREAEFLQVVPIAMLRKD